MSTLNELANSLIRTDSKEEFNEIVNPLTQDQRKELRTILINRSSDDNEMAAYVCEVLAEELKYKIDE